MAITAEQQFDAAISGVVVADRSSVGRIEIAGVDRLDLLHRLSTNALANARQGQIVATVFTTDKGRIIDYVHLLVREHSLLAMVSESSEERFSSWIEKYTIMEDVSLSKVTESTSQYTLVGPNAKQCAEKLFSHPIEQDRFFETTVSGGTVTVAYHKDFSTDFVECIVPTSDASEFADMLRTSGANFNLQMMDRDSFEAFRISRGIPLKSHEITESYNPYEAGLLHAISFTKGCYIGQEVIARLDTYQKVQREMVGIRFSGSANGVVNVAAIILNKEGEEIGILTSLSTIAIRGSIPGIAIIKKSSELSDNTVWARSDGQAIEGTLQQFPLAL